MSLVVLFVLHYHITDHNFRLTKFALNQLFVTNIFEKFETS